MCHGKWMGRRRYMAFCYAFVFCSGVQDVHQVDVQESVYHKYILMCMQQDGKLHSLFIYGNCSTCFGWYPHPSSGAHTTVSTASNKCQML